MGLWYDYNNKYKLKCEYIWRIVPLSTNKYHIAVVSHMLIEL